MEVRFDSSLLEETRRQQEARDREELTKENFIKNVRREVCPVRNYVLNLKGQLLGVGDAEQHRARVEFWECVRSAYALFGSWLLEAGNMKEIMAWPQQELFEKYGMSMDPSKINMQVMPKSVTPNEYMAKLACATILLEILEAAP